MVKLESLKKSIQFKKTLKEKKVHSVFFSIFAAKNFYKPKIIDCETGISGSCRIAPACRLKGIFAQAKRAFLDAMNSPTLDEVISQPKLVSLFDPQAPK